MKRFMGMMPSNEVKIQKEFVDSHEKLIIVQAGENGWTILYTDKSSEYKDVSDTPENNLKKALEVLQDRIGAVKEAEKKPSAFISREEGAKARAEQRGEISEMSADKLPPPGSMYYPLDGSVYDFDNQLIKAGFKILADSPTSMVFGRTFKLKMPTDSLEQDFLLTIKRHRFLYKKGQYDLCSPYSIHFEYMPSATSMIRRIQWDTFGGRKFEHLEQAIALSEKEATQIIQNLNK